MPSAPRPKCRLQINWMVVGVSGYAAGLLLSALLDLPSGAVIVIALAVLAVVLNRVWRCGGEVRTGRSR